jgi:hypothetical protein
MSLLTLQLASSPAASSLPTTPFSCASGNSSLASEEADVGLAVLRSQLRPLNLSRGGSGPLPIPDST